MGGQYAYGIVRKRPEPAEIGALIGLLALAIAARRKR